MKIYIIAGEDSGDIYGAGLIKSLQRIYNDQIDFFGIGGSKMCDVGFKSLFNMSELSIMGFTEIVPHIPKLLSKINDTVLDIQKIQPDIVITIDSPGFCCRVIKKLKGQEDLLDKLLTKLFVKNNAEVTDILTCKFLHYVAPTVWAYKPKRAVRFANIFDHLLAILPFEPPYFRRVGLECSFIGHPIMETNIPIKSDSFRQKHNISANDKLLSIMPGSRKTEVNKLLPIFIQSIKKLDNYENITVAIPTTQSLKDLIIAHLKNEYNIRYIIVEGEQEKLACFKSSDAALIKSGTGTFEVALANCPMVVAYKVNFLSYLIIKTLIKVKYVNLINIILDKEVIPEFLQHNCNAHNLSNKLNELLNDNKTKDVQMTQINEALSKLKIKNQTPSDIAARTVLKLINK